VRPKGTPIGAQLAATAKVVSRAFSDALAAAGGSLPTWLVLSSLKGALPRTQLDLARTMGIEGPTLTRHLDALERDGLVVRVRDADDRRAVRVELTAAGEELYGRLLSVAIAFNGRLTAGLDESELDRLRAGLATLEANVAPSPRE
jgi:MarR family transcriptional regulator, transcriptional regulator for hemolysin